MKKTTVLIAAFGAAIAATSPAYSDHSQYHKESLKITNPDEHNKKLNQCIQTALDRHPGAVTEVEVEMEDGKTIIDVDVQGKDTKTWEVECDAATGEVLEDKEESDDMEESASK